GPASASAFGLTATTIVALVDLQEAVEWEFRPLAQRVAQLVRHQPGRVVAQGQFARQEQRRHAALVLRYQPCRREPFAQRSAGTVKDRPSGHRMLLPAAGAFKNPRSHSQLIGQPPGAPGADKALGPTQLRQCGDARRLIPIAIHERKKPGHRRPCRHFKTGAGYPTTRTYLEHTNPPCANRIERFNSVVLKIISAIKSGL